MQTIQQTHNNRTVIIEIIHDNDKCYINLRAEVKVDDYITNCFFDRLDSNNKLYETILKEIKINKIENTLPIKIIEHERNIVFEIEICEIKFCSTFRDYKLNDKGKENLRIFYEKFREFKTKNTKSYDKYTKDEILDLDVNEIKNVEQYCRTLNFIENNNYGFIGFTKYFTPITHEDTVLDLRNAIYIIKNIKLENIITIEITAEQYFHLSDFRNSNDKINLSEQKCVVNVYGNNYLKQYSTMTFLLGVVYRYVLVLHNFNIDKLNLHEKSPIVIILKNCNPELEIINAETDKEFIIKI